MMTMKRRASSAVIVSIARSQGAGASSGTLAPAGCTIASFLSAFPNHKSHLAFYSAISGKVKSSSGKALKFQPELRNDLNNVNSLDDALSLFERMVRMRPLPSVIQFNQLLTCIVKMKNHYSSVISLFRDMSAKGIPIDDYTLTLVIKCCCFVGRVDLAFSTLAGFFKRGFVPDAVTFSTLLRGLFRECKIPQAQELFKKIIFEKLCEPDEVIFLVVIDGLCKAGNTQMAIEFLRLMEKRRRCKPNVYVYGAIIDSLCKDKMVDEALALLQEMFEKGIPPDVVIYNCLIQGFCNLSKWKEVKRLFSDMKDYKIVPDVITFNIVVDALCKEGHAKDAEEVVGIMIQQGQNPNVVTYNSLMDGYCLQRRIDEARRVFDTMVASGLDPDVITYNTMIAGLLSEGLLIEGKELVEKMEEKGSLANSVTYNVILQGLLKGGHYDDAMVYHEEMVHRGFLLDASTFSILLDLSAENQNNPSVLMLMLKIDPNSKKFMDGGQRGPPHYLCHKGLDLDEKTYTPMIAGLLSESLLAEAKELFEKMEENGCWHSVMFNVILQGLLRGDHYDDAVVYYEEMVRREFLLDSSTFSVLLDSSAGGQNNPSLLMLMLKIDPDSKMSMIGG
ncbi:unnamed protein product [Coffea canephora]|uniref:Pentacotripeptide-repeat region of PRORP domain-containing protein n=1 Tax=Coffea canephora TaxID=49390 RepID=A0A068UAI9_COFCA|nr:unnamed protein product [Coffea canephora]